MKRLVLVRHAKAVHWGYQDDFNRELSKRGERDAAKVSSHLREEGILPDLMITSPALRAFQTAMIFAETFGYSAKEIRKESDLYPGYSTPEFLERLQSLPRSAEIVFVFGHNPSMEEYASHLSTYFGREVPTCSSMVIDFDIDSWTEIGIRTGILSRQVNPKEL